MIFNRALVFLSILGVLSIHGVFIDSRCFYRFSVFFIQFKAPSFYSILYWSNLNSPFPRFARETRIEAVILCFH